MLKVLQYPQNADGTPMDLEVGVLTDATGNGGARLVNAPVGPDGAPIDAKAMLLVDSDGNNFSDAGYAVLKYKSSLPNTYTRSGAALKALGADDNDGISLVHWIDPSFDDELLAGVGTPNLDVYLANAAAALAGVYASTGRRLQLTIPPLIYPVADTWTLNIPNLLVSAKGARLLSSMVFAHGLLMVPMTATDVTIDGLRLSLTGGSATPWNAEIQGANCKLIDVLQDKDEGTGGTVMYIRGTADGFRAFRGGIRSSNGINIYNVGDFDFNYYSFIGKTAGADDAIAWKSYTGMRTGGFVRNSRVENMVSIFSLGSEIGNPGANDPTPYSKGIWGFGAFNNVAVNCGYMFMLKPGGVAVDFRDGLLGGGVLSNNVMIDMNGTAMNHGIAALVGRGCKMISMHGTGNKVIGRVKAGAPDGYGTYLSILDFGVGTNGPDISDYEVQVEIIDPYKGVAAGSPGVPGQPFKSGILIEKQNVAVGTASGVVVNASIDGTWGDAVSVGGGLDNAVTMSRVHAKNYGNESTATFGGIGYASAIKVGDDVTLVPVAGSAAPAYKQRAGGSVAQILPKQLPASSFVGNPTGAVADATVFGLTGGLGFAGGLLTINGAIAPTAINATGAVNSTASNVTSTLTNTSGSPTDVPVFSLSRTNNEPAPTIAGSAFTIISHQLDWSLNIKNGAGTSRFSVGPSGNTIIAGTVTIGATQVFNNTGVLQAAAVPTFTGGDVTSAGGSLVLSIGANLVTYAKFQQVAANSLVGNPTGSTANAQAITLNGGLGFSGTTLTINGAITAAASIAIVGGITSSGGGIGYVTGAGGTVTQATSKATAVTLNKLCGQITMNAAALAANTVVNFTLNNSLLAAGDELRVWIAGGEAISGSYLVTQSGNASGSRIICLRNLTAGSFSEAVVVGFLVNKATNA
jgi:hypothetical protein